MQADQNPLLSREPRDLGLQRLPRRRKNPLTFSTLREVTEEDIVLISEVPAGHEHKPLQKIRDSHHLVARLLAEGFQPVEVSRISGYSPSRISFLKNDPSFKELLAFYRSRVDDQFTDTIQRLKTLGEDAIGEIMSRLDENPESLSTMLLVDIVKATMDRSGFGPQSKSLNLNANVHLNEDDIAKIKAEARSQSGGQIRAPRRLSHNPGLANGGSNGTSQILDATPTEGQES